MAATTKSSISSYKQNQSQMSPKTVFPQFYSPSNNSNRIYMTFKSKDAILSERSPQSTNYFEKCKKDRKQIEELTQVMLNRVSLLQHQEVRTNKNISFSQRITEQIQQNKSRVQQEKLDKFRFQQQRSEEIQRNKEKINNLKQLQREERQRMRQEWISRKLYERNLIKNQSLQNDQRIKQFNQTYSLTNNAKKHQIKQEYELGNQRIGEFFHQRKNDVKQQINKQVLQELERKKQLEINLKKIESQEAEQFEKLNQTQQTEKQINEKLQTMRARPIGELSFRQTQMEFRLNQTNNSYSPIMNGSLVDPLTTPLEKNQNNDFKQEQKEEQIEQEPNEQTFEKQIAKSEKEDKVKELNESKQLQDEIQMESMQKEGNKEEQVSQEQQEQEELPNKDDQSINQVVEEE